MERYICIIIVLHLDVVYYNQNKKGVLFKFPVDIASLEELN